MRSVWRHAGAIAALGALLWTMNGCGDGKAEPITLTVAVGDGLRLAMPEVAEPFESRRPDIKLAFSFANAGTIASQVRHGAQVDVVIVPSGGGHMDALNRDGLFQPGSRQTVAGDQLLLIVPKQTTMPQDPWQWLTSNGVKRLAIGDPKTVPVGAYAMEVLRHLGVADALEPKLIHTGSVRQSLTYVEQGEVEAALVFRSTLMNSEKAQMAAAAPPGSHQPILFEAAAIKDTGHPEAAAAFLEYLLEPEVVETLIRYGFTAPPND